MLARTSPVVTTPSEMTSHFKMDDFFVYTGKLKKKQKNISDNYYARGILFKTSEDIGPEI